MWDSFICLIYLVTGQYNFESFFCPLVKGINTVLIASSITMLTLRRYCAEYYIYVTVLISLANSNPSLYDIMSMH